MVVSGEIIPSGIEKGVAKGLARQLEKSRLFNYPQGVEYFETNEYLSSLKGLIRSEGLQFKINYGEYSSTFELEVRPLDKLKWTSFKKHIEERIQDKSFWEDPKLKDSLKSEYLFRSTDFNYKLSESSRKCSVKFQLKNKDPKIASYAIWNRFVLPILLYKNFRK